MSEDTHEGIHVYSCECYGHLIAVRTYEEENHVELALYERMGTGNPGFVHRLRLAWWAFRGSSTSEVYLSIEDARRFAQSVSDAADEAEEWEDA